MSKNVKDKKPLSFWLIIQIKQKGLSSFDEIKKFVKSKAPHFDCLMHYENGYYKGLYFISNIDSRRFRIPGKGCFDFNPKPNFYRVIRNKNFNKSNKSLRLLQNRRYQSNNQ